MQVLHKKRHAGVWLTCGYVCPHMLDAMMRHGKRQPLQPPELGEVHACVMHRGKVSVMNQSECERLTQD